MENIQIIDHFGVPRKVIINEQEIVIELNPRRVLGKYLFSVDSRKFAVRKENGEWQIEEWTSSRP